MLKTLADLNMSGREVNRLTRKIGEELARAEQQRTEKQQNRELEVEVKNPPEVVVAEMQRRADPCACGRQGLRSP